MEKFSNCFAFVDSLKFSCKLVEYFYRKEFVEFKTKITSPRNKIQHYPVGLENGSIHEILLTVLQEIEIAGFDEYLSGGVNNVMKEALWQQHFFLAFWKFFPKKIHPEVGAYFNTNGI